MVDTERTPRQRRRQKRLNQIQEEAMKMVVEEGIEGFGINKLAQRLDLTPGALYRYFDSRDEILAAVEIEVLQGFDTFFKNLVESVAERGGLEKLVCLVMGYVALEELQPQRFRLIGQFVAGPDPVLDDQLAADVVGPTLQVVGRFVSAIEEAQGDGSLSDGDPLLRAALTWSSLQGLLTHKKLTRLPQVPLSPDELIAELLRTLFAGWGAEPSALKEAMEKQPDMGFYRQIMEKSK